MSEALELLHAAFHQRKTPVYRAVQGTVWVLILLSIVFLIAEALLPEGSEIVPWLVHIDRILLSIFGVEIFLRVATFRPPTLEVLRKQPIGRLRVHVLARLGFLVRPMMLVDMLAVLAFFPELRGLRALRLLRLLRTIRIFQYRNPFAIVMRALEENALLFAFAFSILGATTILGGLSIYLVEARANPSIDSIIDGMWWALVTVTTVGFGDITPVTLLGRIIGGVLMIGGMFTLALFAGIVGSSLVSGVLSIREEQFRMSDYVNHIVVCGYDESTHLLLGALSNELDVSSTRVVIIDVHERPREVPPEFLWVQGDPTKESELDKVRIAQAASVIVSGERDTTPQAADARTILITFTIRSFMERRRFELQRHRRLYLVAEILDCENVDHAKAAGADEVIETRRIGYSMIAHAVGHHGTASTMSRVLISGSHNVYIGRIPEEIELPISFGDLLTRMALSKHGGLVIGLRFPSGDEVLNAPKSRRIEKGTLLIYLAESSLLESPA